MEKKDIILVENDEDISESSVMVVNHKGKRKKRKKEKRTFKRLIVFGFLMFLSYYIYTNFDIISDFFKFNEITDSIQGDTDSDNGIDTDTDIDSSHVSNESIVPEGAHQILNANGCFTEINDESLLSMDLESISATFPRASEIYSKYGNEAPCILVIHSSPLMAYSNGQYYFQNDAFYDNQQNASEIGKIICDELNKSNINAIHLDTVFANGAIHNSRAEYEKALSDILKRYPSISYVINVSRDVIINDDLTMNKMVCEANGEKMAQIKITVGTSSKDDFWHKNLFFARELAIKNSELIYDVTMSPFSLSQNVLPISINVDIGSFSNTFEEASLSARAFASSLHDILS